MAQKGDNPIRIRIRPMGYSNTTAMTANVIQ
jgi:hypothetical protein